MRDVLFLTVLIAFFAISVLFVHACDRIIGPDLEADLPADADEAFFAERTAA